MMDVREHRYEDDRLASVHSYKLLDTEADESFDALTRLAAGALHAPIALLSLIDADRQWFLSSFGGDLGSEIPRKESICSDTVAAGELIVVNDLQAQPRYSDIPAVTGSGLRSYAGVPLVGRDGLPLGTLCVLDDHTRTYSEPELSALNDLARQAVSVLELRRSDESQGLTAAGLVPEARNPRELRRALDNHEFVPYFQPLIDMRDGTVTGLEALVRWKHPTRGLLQPAAFLPGLDIGSMAGWAGRAVVEAACTLAASIRARGFDLCDGIAINISGRELTRPAVISTVLDVVAAHGLPPRALTVEVIETSEVSDLAAARTQLLRLHDAGVRVVADDFGVGWSNLVRLVQLPLSGLKIDRQLVTGMIGDRVRDHMVASVVGLAEAMGFSVIAEGVETAEVRDRLLDLGCFRGQGWLYSGALPAAAIPALLAARALPVRTSEVA